MHNCVFVFLWNCIYYWLYTAVRQIEKICASALIKLSGLKNPGVGTVKFMLTTSVLSSGCVSSTTIDSVEVFSICLLHHELHFIV